MTTIRHPLTFHGVAKISISKEREYPQDEQNSPFFARTIKLSDPEGGEMTMVIYHDRSIEVELEKSGD